MIKTLAISNYRSLLNLVIPFGNLNLITGENASGKFNLYKALRLLSETAQGGVVNSLAREGGLTSTFWAGPTAFSLDPEIKRESIWAGDFYRPASALVDREGSLIKVNDKRSWEVIHQHASNFDSIFTQATNPEKSPEVLTLKEHIRGWRFYDHFRSDAEAPSRLPQLGTRTPVLHHDGRDLAAALQTIIEIGDVDALHEAISDAFPGAKLSISIQEDGRFIVNLHQHGLLRPLSASELSDGTLRYLLWVAALLTPRPPTLMVLNEPETSLHPDLLPALGRLIIRAASITQVWVVSHSNRLIAALESAEDCNSVRLEKTLGQTKIVGQDMLDEPMWKWPDHNK